MISTRLKLKILILTCTKIPARYRIARTGVDSTTNGRGNTFEDDWQKGIGPRDK
jgi:hypothetical protein